MSKKKAFVDTQTPLTAPIFYILLSLSIQQRHGYDIMKQVALDSQNKVNLGAGTLYGAIKRMLEDDLIIELDHNSESRRKYYQLTKKGREILSNELTRYEEAVTIARQRNVQLIPVNQSRGPSYA